MRESNENILLIIINAFFINPKYNWMLVASNRGEITNTTKLYEGFSLSKFLLLSESHSFHKN